MDTTLLVQATALRVTGLLLMLAWMPDSAQSVFAEHEWWRPWTALFIHADFGHLASNGILFIPLTFLLAGYFGAWFFPIFGIFIGGLVNFLVLLTMPDQTELLGMSGMGYWMGAAWFTLYLILDTRYRLRRRFAYVIFLSMMMFVPETYQPDVSYMSHLFGFIAGVISALMLFALRRSRFRAAEITEIIVEEA